MSTISNDCEKVPKLVEALGNPIWKKAMEAEIFSIEKNGTWVLVDRPLDKKVIKVKWIFKIKYNTDGSLDKYKV